MQNNIENQSSINNQQEYLKQIIPHIKTEDEDSDFANDDDGGFSSCNIEVDEGDVNQEPEKFTTTVNHFCSRCGEEFPNLQYVQVHEAVHTSKLICSVCNKIFKSQRHFVQHIASHLKKPLTCQHCPEIFFDKRSYNLHLYCHKNIKTYVCEYCPKEWSNKKDLKIHIRVHTNERPYPCAVCGKSFKQRGALSTHANLHSPETKLIKTKHCDICNGSYSSVSSLNKHMRRIHAAGKTFPCRQCGERFLNFLQMKRHKVEAHPELVFNKSCSLRGKLFACKETFVKHQQEHVKNPKNHYNTRHKRVKFTCKICEYTFRHKKLLVTHWKAHHNLKCHSCQTRFETKLALMTHIKIKHKGTHTSGCGSTVPVIENKMIRNSDKSVIKYNCKPCKLSYCSKTLLKDHMKSHKKKCFQCGNCKKHFLYPANLLFHVKQNICLKYYDNRKDQGFICTLCKKEYTTIESLLSHMRIHIKLYKCKFCNSTFKQKDLQGHINRAHRCQAKFGCAKSANSSVSEVTKHKNYFHRERSSKGDIEDNVLNETLGGDGDIKIEEYEYKPSVDDLIKEEPQH